MIAQKDAANIGMLDKSDLQDDGDDFMLGDFEELPEMDQDTEKMMKGLYRTFDVKNLKGKMWNTLANGQIKRFNEVLSEVSSNVGFDVKETITTPSCFVTLLMLANEKQLELLQEGPNNFSIKAAN